MIAGKLHRLQAWAVLFIILAVNGIGAAVAENFMEVVNPVAPVRLEESQVKAASRLPESVFVKRHRVVALDWDAFGFSEKQPSEQQGESYEETLLFTPFDGESFFLRNTSKHGVGQSLAWNGVVLDATGADIGLVRLMKFVPDGSVRGTLEFHNGYRSFTIVPLPNSPDSLLYEPDFESLQEANKNHGQGKLRTREEKQAALRAWREILENDPEYRAFRERRAELIESDLQEQAVERARGSNENPLAGEGAKQ